jgi:hypothetical protein
MARRALSSPQTYWAHFKQLYIDVFSVALDKIGYIVDMSPGEIEIEVNNYQKKYMPYCPAIAFTFGIGRLFKTSQQIPRRNVEPARFELIHLWVNFKNKSYS